MGTFVACWVPFFTWYMVSALCGNSCQNPEWLVQTMFWIGYFNSTLNPIIYGKLNKTDQSNHPSSILTERSLLKAYGLCVLFAAYFNRDFRDAFKETIQCVFLFPKKDNMQSYV